MPIVLSAPAKRKNASDEEEVQKVLDAMLARLAPTMKPTKQRKVKPLRPLPVPPPPLPPSLVSAALAEGEMIPEGQVVLVVTPEGALARASYRTMTSGATHLKDTLKVHGFKFYPSHANAWAFVGPFPTSAFKLLSLALEKRGLTVKRVGFNPRSRKTSLPPMRNNGDAKLRAVYSPANMAWIVFFGDTPTNVAGSNYFETKEELVALLRSLGLRMKSDGEIVMAKAPAKRANGSRSVADPVAARELELYIENERNLVGPGNSIGANIMRMLAGRIVRGTYDSTKAWKAWVPLVTEGAKRYKREFGPINANKATRDAVATRLSEAFEGEIRVGALDPMKLLGARNNRGMPVAQGNQMPQTRSNSSTAVPPLSKWEKGDYAYVVSGSGMLRGQQLVIQNLSSVGSAWVAYTRSASRPNHVSVALADDAGTGFYGMTEDGLRREYSRFSHATPGAARAVLVKASRWYGSRR
jgi:hypothetical protein